MSLYIKIELFSRYPRLVLSSPSLPIALVNAKYNFILLEIFSDKTILP